jgi:hypothetical protein
MKRHTDINTPLIIIVNGHSFIFFRLIDIYSIPKITSPFYHNSKHFFDFLDCGGSKAAIMASSNTFLSPFCVKAEHSTYFTAPNSLANFSPTSKVIAFCLFLANLSFVAVSSLKSTCVPTTKQGTPGQ